MAKYTYPSNDLERGRLLLSNLGSFWSSMYDGSAHAESYVKGRALLEQQSHLNLIEAAACAGRTTVPVFHEENWLLLRAKQSEMSTATGSLLAYDDGGVHGASDVDGFVYKYGLAREGKFAINVPEDLRAVPVIFNRITDASLCWVDGVDYKFLPDKSAIVFNENPLDNDLVEVEATWEGGEITDREFFLWAFKAKQDYNHLYDHFAHVLGAQIKSGEASRDLLNAIFDAIAGGTAKAQVETALSALSGIPLVKGTEIVEVVTNDADSLLIITDKNSYSFPTGLTAAVSVGDGVMAGKSFVTAFKFYTFNRGQLSPTLGSLSLGSDFLATGFYGDLQFNNKDVALVVEEGVPPISLTRSVTSAALADFAAEGFTQYINVFGIPVLGTAGVNYNKFNHVVNVLAEYLDNNKDGRVDNKLVGDALLTNLAVLLVVEDQDELDALDPSAWEAAGFSTLSLLDGEILPTDSFDRTLEITLNLITSLGYATVYPTVFGTDSASELSQLVVGATAGGIEPPLQPEYAAAAWYHNYDAECDSACQATDYLYWSLTSVLGAQEAYCDVLRDIWELCTEEDVRTQDPGIYSLLRDPLYAFPQFLPAGNYVNYTKITFEIDGFPLDIDKFFDDVHAAGVARNQTLAHLLDTRTNKVGEPGSSNLPATINPLKFLTENILRANVFVVRIAAAAFGANAAGLQHMHLLRKIIPPHTAMITVLELQGFKDFVTIEESDSLSIFTGTTPMRDTITIPDGADRVGIRLVTGTCQ